MPPLRQLAFFGRYELIKRLATGGMAEIWLARQRGLAGFNRFVVIKKILNHLSVQQAFVEMFLDEAKMSAQLNHPNIVQIYDLGKEGESYYIAMEFIDGENLSQIIGRSIKQQHLLSTHLAVRIIADTCKALHFAHHFKGADGKSLEIVHRDVSPQNILVTYAGEVKVVDFGIAKAGTQTEHTQAGMIKGKFSYMSPEQCQGERVDMRSDIFSLGILLYEACTSKRLFKHESELMILDMITKREIIPPSSLRPDISPALEDIILRALCKDPALRYQTAQELQLALEQFLQREKVAATNTDIAAYMQSLFAEHIEQKQKLRERVLRPSPHTEPAEAKTVYRATSKGGRSRRFWIGAVVGLLAAGSIGYLSLQAYTALKSTTQFGTLPVDSVPSGADIYLDDRPVLLASGQPAKTPSDLTHLRYHTHVKLTLSKSGYDRIEQTIIMDASSDGHSFCPELTPHAGTILIRQAEKDQAEIFINGISAGSAHEIQRILPAFTRVMIEARHKNSLCQVDPATVHIKPDAIVESNVHCHALPVPAPPRRPAPKHLAPSALLASTNWADGDCQSDPKLPMGYITIGTTPVADIYLHGQKIGQTPLARYKVNSGCIEITAVSLTGHKVVKRLNAEPNRVLIYQFSVN